MFDDDSEHKDDSPHKGVVTDFLFRRAVDASVDGVAVVDFARRIVYVNEARASMHGYTPDELIGKTVDLLTRPPMSVKNLAQHVTEAGYWHGEVTGLRKDGSTFPAMQTISRIDGTDGIPVAMLSLTRDITDLKHSEDEAQRRTQQLGHLLEASREINSAMDTSTVLRLMVAHGISLVGASGGMAGLYTGDAVVIREYHQNGGVTPVDYRFQRGYGGPGWVIEHRSPYLTNDATHDPQTVPHFRKTHDFNRAINVPLIGSQGELLAVMSVHSRADNPELTDDDVRLLQGLANQAAVALRNAVLAEDLLESSGQLRKNEETLRLVVEGSPDFFFYVHDERGFFTYVSPSVETITGRTVDEWKTHYTLFLTDNPANDRVVEYTEKTLLTGEITPSYPVEVFHKSGERIMLEVYERPIHEGSRVVGIRGVARDVTELRKAESAQQAIQEEAERAQRAFYRDTILSVTDGRLVICDSAEADEFRCEPVFPAIEIAEPKDVSMAREEVRTVAVKSGMDSGHADELVLCVGEAATNALKHCGGGTVSVCDRGDSLSVRIADAGPGMDSLALPKMTLMKGYSTKPSLGMGYAAILALADKVYLATGPTGTTVEIVKLKQPASHSVRPEDLPDLW